MSCKLSYECLTGATNMKSMVQNWYPCRRQLLHLHFSILFALKFQRPTVLASTDSLFSFPQSSALKINSKLSSKEQHFGMNNQMDYISQNSIYVVHIMQRKHIKLCAISVSIPPYVVARISQYQIHALTQTVSRTMHMLLRQVSEV